MNRQPRKGTKVARYHELLTKVITDGAQTVSTSKIKNTQDFRVRIIQCQAQYFPSVRFAVNINNDTQTARVSLRDDPLATDDDFDY